MTISKNNSFRNFVIILFLALLLPQVFQEGLFVDGLTYSTIAFNLSEGIGSYWNPVFSATVMNDFHEHPPMAFILQSVFFDLFGNGFYVEKLYSFLTAILTALLIIGIWKRITNSKEFKALYWLPFLFWISVPLCFWSYNNNVLENTMGLFSLGAIYLLIISIKKNIALRLLLFCFSGILLLLAFLTKGFPALFPLAFLLLYYIVHHKIYNLKRMFLDTAMLLLLTFATAFLFFIFDEAARENISVYISTQVFESIRGERLVVPRYFIMKRIVEELMIVTGICLVLILVSYKSAKQKIKENPEVLRNCFLFLLIGLSASLPIMISPKQLSFYMIPSLPYFAIGLSLLIAPFVNEYIKKINERNFLYKLFKYQVVVTIPILLFFTISSYGTFSRDYEMIHDVDLIGQHLGETKTIDASSSLSREWSLMGYLQRKHHISLDLSGTGRAYMLTGKTETVPENYSVMNIGLLDFQLLRKNTKP